MPVSEQYFRKVMSGQERSTTATCLRAAASIAEPIYAGIMRARNRLYDHQFLKSYPLGKPTISVGNITTGGTGKTPVVRWLAEQLRAAGHTPAVLMRGYKSVANQSDEQMELAGDGILAIANPDRKRGSEQAITQQPSTDVFILDDGMQHRRAARDFEIVLIHAGEPFGFGHVFPRGLLRESLSGLRRASAIILTHASEIDEESRKRILSKLAGYTAAPVYFADHQITNFIDSKNTEISADQLKSQKVFAFCGIGSPDGFFEQLKSHLGSLAGTQTFNDHHHYASSELSELQQSARSAGADALVTTEKDWTKIAPLSLPNDFLPIVRARLALRFAPNHESQLLEQVLETLTTTHTPRR